MKLEDIAIVTAGYAFRAAIEPSEDGYYRVFQAKDLVLGRPIVDVDVDALTPISFDQSRYDGYLQTSDVLLIARGMKHGTFSSAVFASYATNVVASSSIHVIHVTSPVVYAEYLSQYLNSKEGQKSLSKIVSGSYIGAIPRKDLNRIEIPVPTLGKQQALVELHKNIKVQQEILVRRSELQQQIIEAAFKSVI